LVLSFCRLPFLQARTLDRDLVQACCWEPWQDPSGQCSAAFDIRPDTIAIGGAQRAHGMADTTPAMHASNGDMGPARLRLGRLRSTRLPNRVPPPKDNPRLARPRRARVGIGLQRYFGPMLQLISLNTYSFQQGMTAFGRTATTSSWMPLLENSATRHRQQRRRSGHPTSAAVCQQALTPMR